MPSYVHGYSEREAVRLQDQAGAVREFILHDTAYRPGELVLEAGCGVGAQTLTLASQSPGARFVSIDIAADSLAQAARAVGGAGLFALPCNERSFDHAFICYVLEHLADPAGALRAAARAVKPGGTITVIEGDHGSCFWHPETPESVAAWRCLVRAQAQLGGNSLIGRELYPLMAGAGLGEVRISPRMIYIDMNRPELKDSFVRKTIIAMVLGVREKALERGLISEAEWERGIADLNRVADSPEGVFIYTFFKGVGRVA